MRKFVGLLAAVAVCVTMGATVFAAGSPFGEPLPTPTPVPQATPTPTPEVTPVATPIPTPKVPDEETNAASSARRDHYIITINAERTPGTAPQTSDLYIVPVLGVVAVVGTGVAVVARKKKEA